MKKLLLLTLFICSIGLAKAEVATDQQMIDDYLQGRGFLINNLRVTIGGEMPITEDEKNSYNLYVGDKDNNSMSLWVGMNVCFLKWQNARIRSIGGPEMTDVEKKKLMEILF